MLCFASSPRKASPEVRDELIAVAARLLAQEGSAALTLRRVATEAGTSTMAVYTHFGGMEALRRAVRRRGYVTLAAALEAAQPELDDLCRAYNAFARSQPDLYRVMFMEAPLDEADAAECAGTFDILVAGAGGDHALATELWAAGHGVATLSSRRCSRPDEADAVAGALREKILRR